MTRITYHFIGCFIIVLLSSISAVQGQSNITYTAILNGANVLPPVNTSALGKGEIIRDVDDSGFVNVLYNITLHNISKIKAIELHNAPEGLNGTVVYSAFAISDMEENNALSISGNLFPPFFQTSLGGKADQPGMAEMDYGFDGALLRELSSNYTYIDVHTEEYPEGEIRGQFYEQ